MDPGLSLLEHIKSVPNLVHEDPSIVTPQNSAFVDRPWSELGWLKHRSFAKKVEPIGGEEVISEAPDTTMMYSAWDSSTTFQDTSASRKF
ncbi:hypothetical protein BX666DRAFT_1998930 [Dichotomocladium elegans]|nr:hypothetical protein BX666DRAFT_1998930 [Dichotomocladium elegans]